MKSFLTIIILSLFISGCTIIALEVSSDVFKRIEAGSSIDFWKNGYPREEFHFYSGKNKLQGFIYGSENDKGLAVISHGLQTYADENFRMIMYLVDNDWRVFSYNNTGVAGSEGYSMIGLPQGLLDLKAALNYIENKNEFDDLPVMLIGYSWGGYSVCAVLNFNYRIKAVVSLAGYNSATEVMEKQAVDAVGGIYHLVSPQTLELQNQLFGETAKLTAVDGINKTRIPVLIVISSDDDIIPPNTISIYAHRKKITNPYAEYLYLEGENAGGHRLRNYTKEILYIKVNDFLERSKKKVLPLT